MTESKSDKKIRLLFGMVLLITAVVTITVFSKSSFLYPLNDWVDSNCFFTMGKGILHGKVPYRDLYDHKGPVLYFIHALAAMISSDSFLGVYFIEAAACFGFLFYSYKTLQLFTDNKRNILLIMVLSFFVYSSAAFCHGDSVEEFCLPLLAYTQYIGMKCIRDGKIPGFKESLFIGITSSCVLWMKYTILGFYIGWVILPIILLIRKKYIKELFKMLGTILLGVIAITIPVLLYFAANHALGDLFSVYFYNNIFMYNTRDSNTHSFIYYFGRNLKNAFIGNKFLMVFLIIGIAGLWTEKKMLMQYIITLAVTCLFILSPSAVYRYYPLVLNVFGVFGIMAISKLLDKVNGRIALPSMIAADILAFTLCYFASPNTYLILKDKDELPQYKFKKIIEQTDDATLLNYGFLDGGFYTVCNIVPDCRYFCKLNIRSDEMLGIQDEYLDERLADYVVTRGEKLENDNYSQVAVASYYFEGGYYTYYLYKMNDTD